MQDIHGSVVRSHSSDVRRCGITPEGNGGSEGGDNGTEDEDEEGSEGDTHGGLCIKESGWKFGIESTAFGDSSEMQGTCLGENESRVGPQYLRRGGDHIAGLACYRSD